MAGWNGIFKDGVFGCGFDMSPTAAQLFNQTVNGLPSSTVTPFGSGFSWQLGGNTTAGKLLNVNLTTLLIGLRLFSPGFPATSQIICTWYDVTANAAQVTLRVFNDGSFRFFLGTGTGTPLGSFSAVGLFNVSSWLYLEAKVTISATVGVVELRVNGNTTPVITASSLNTKSTANTFANAFQMTGIVANTNFDDWYMLDMTGASPLNTYLGNIRAVYDAPNANSAAGSHNQWTPTNPTNVNFSNVSSIPAVTTKFNSDATVGDIDFYAFPAVSFSPASILFLNEWMQLDLDSAGARTIAAGVRSGGSDTFDTAQPITPPNGTPFGLFNEPWTVDPNTSAAWGVTAAGNVELGVKVNT
jgi:hypothetical protein